MNIYWSEIVKFVAIAGIRGFYKSHNAHEKITAYSMKSLFVNLL